MKGSVFLNRERPKETLNLAVLLDIANLNIICKIIALIKDIKCRY